MNNSDQSSDLLALTTEIVAAHVSNNTVSVGDLPQLINQVYNSLANIGSVPAAPAERPQPAVPVKKSVHPDLHRLPGGREEAQDAETAFEDRLQHDARGLS